MIPEILERLAKIEAEISAINDAGRSLRQDLSELREQLQVRASPALKDCMPDPAYPCNATAAGATKPGGWR